MGQKEQRNDTTASVARSGSADYRVVSSYGASCTERIGLTDGPAGSGSRGGAGIPDVNACQTCNTIPSDSPLCLSHAPSHSTTCNSVPWISYSKNCEWYLPISSLEPLISHDFPYTTYRGVEWYPFIGTMRVRYHRYPLHDLIHAADPSLYRDNICAIEPEGRNYDIRGTPSSVPDEGSHSISVLYHGSMSPAEASA